ncbi:MAG: hypothetical protein V9F00_01075 [Nocardioides sp.]
MLRKPSRWRSTRAVIALGVAFALAFGAIAVSPSTAASSLTIASIWKSIKKKTDKRYYTKAKSDARYVKKPTVVRGTWAWSVEASPDPRVGLAAIQFGVTLPAAPVVHVISYGASPPAGCSGTTELPSAAPGHLCVFEGLALNVGTWGTLNARNGNGSERFGAVVYAYPVVDSYAAATGTWALGTGPSAVWAKQDDSKGGESVLPPGGGILRK